MRLRSLHYFDQLLHFLFDDLTELITCEEVISVQEFLNFD